MILKDVYFNFRSKIIVCRSWGRLNSHSNCKTCKIIIKNYVRLYKYEYEMNLNIIKNFFMKNEFKYDQNKKIKIYMKKYGQKIYLNRCKTKRWNLPRAFGLDKDRKTIFFKSMLNNSPIHLIFCLVMHHVLKDTCEGESERNLSI